MFNSNLLLTEHESCSGEYWAEVMAVRTEYSEVCTKNDWEPIFSSVTRASYKLVSTAVVDYMTLGPCMFWIYQLSQTKNAQLMTINKYMKLSCMTFVNCAVPYYMYIMYVKLTGSDSSNSQCSLLSDCTVVHLQLFLARTAHLLWTLNLQTKEKYDNIRIVSYSDIAPACNDLKLILVAIWCNILCLTSFCWHNISLITAYVLGSF